MIQREYYNTGELKSEGDCVNFIICTSRGSGKPMLNDSHEGCVECVFSSKKIKSGIWNFYYKTGQLFMTGQYVVLDYIDLPCVKNGIWTTYYKNEKIYQQIKFNLGEVIEILFFDEEENSFDKEKD